MNRRDFMQTTGTVLASLSTSGWAAGQQGMAEPRLISPGCRRSRVKVARLYMGIPNAHYPNPAMDLNAEVRAYQARFAGFKDELADVDFVVDELIGSPEQLTPLKSRLQNVDGILVIHLTLGTLPTMKELFALGRPVMIFSAPYAGHEWYYLSEIRRSELGRKMECALTTDYHELAAAVRPFRAMHHLREARIVNVAAANNPANYPADVHKKFGTEIIQVGRQELLDAYQAVSEPDARLEAERWTKGAMAVVEPSAEEIFKSCRLALALQRVLDEKEATVATVDCYGSMWRQLPAYPCMGFARLNDLGLGGICQSDLPCAMVHILFQGLTGRPSFVCNPTFDFSTNTATLIHCLGCTRMDGPDKPAAAYKLRDVMERQEGCVPQVRMRVGQQVTQAIMADMNNLRYFTGTITDTPETDRGCRTKIAVKVDGNAERLWQNWSAGIHRVACYGDLSKDLARFCRFAELKLMDEAA